MSTLIDLQDGGDGDSFGDKKDVNKVIWFYEHKTELPTE